MNNQAKGSTNSATLTSVALGERGTERLRSPAPDSDNVVMLKLGPKPVKMRYTRGDGIGALIDESVPVSAQKSTRIFAYDKNGVVKRFDPCMWGSRYQETENTVQNRQTSARR